MSSCRLHLLLVRCHIDVHAVNCVLQLTEMWSCPCSFVPAQHDVLAGDEVVSLLVPNPSMAPADEVQSQRDTDEELVGSTAVWGETARHRTRLTCGPRRTCDSRDA